MKQSSGAFLEKLLSVFKLYPQVKLVYFFGSRVKDKSGPLSDYDFAVYLDEKDKKLRFDIKLSLMGKLSYENMSSLTVIETKISHIQKYLQLLERYKKFSQEQIEQNQDLKGAVERYLYLGTQAALDLGEAIIAFKDFRRPGTYTEVFYILSEQEFIRKELSEKLVNMTKFRNVIAHDYEKVDFGIVYDALQNRLADIEKFIKAVKEKLNL